MVRPGLEPGAFFTLAPCEGDDLPLIYRPIIFISRIDKKPFKTFLLKLKFMFIPLEFGKINSFQLNTYAFSKSALNVYEKNKNLEYHKKIVENLKEGKINAVVTPNELSGLKGYLGEKKYEKFINQFGNLKNQKFFA